MQNHLQEFISHASPVCLALLQAVMGRFAEEIEAGIACTSIDIEACQALQNCLSGLQDNHEVDAPSMALMEATYYIAKGIHENYDIDEMQAIVSILGRARLLMIQSTIASRQTHQGVKRNAK
jgi:hypothetical protein